MSSNRQRGINYANSVASAKRNRRDVQPNVFGRKQDQNSTPAYISHARGEVDNIADDTRAIRLEEKELQRDGNNDDVDQKQFKTGPDTGRTIQATKVSSSDMNQASENKSAFYKCWTAVDDVIIPVVYHDEKSSWTPNAIAYFEILNKVEEILNGNEELRWVSPNYFSLPVRVYYAVLFYVQILRAKTESGTISKSESSWLRAFFRRYKDTMLPVVGPLVPILTNIVSVLPDDDQYDYVYPTCPARGTYEVDKDNGRRKLIVHGHHHLLPSVVLIASMLRDYCRSTGIGDHNFDDDGQYVPFDLNVGGEFAGITFPSQAGRDPAIAALLTNPVMKPLPEGKDRLLEVHAFWRRSKTRNIPNIATDQPYAPNGPSFWTLLGDDLDWFQPCVDFAQIQVRFFSESGNLSEIPTVGGNATLVTAKIHPQVQKKRPTQTDSWFPTFYSSLKATFKATCAELDQDHVYAAAYALTNATLVWTVDGHEIGTQGSLLRSGPYFENEKVTYRNENETAVNGRIYTMIQTQFYDSHTIQGKN